MQNDPLTNALSAFSTVNNVFANQRAEERQAKLDAENTRRWEADNTRAQESHALNMQAGALNLSNAQDTQDEHRLAQFVDQIKAADGNDEQILNAYQSADPKIVKKVAGLEIFKNAPQRVQSYKSLGDSYSAMIKEQDSTGGPPSPQTMAGVQAAVNQVLAADGRTAGLENVQAGIETLPNGKFRIPVTYTKGGKAISAYLTDGKLLTSEGGVPTEYEPNDLMGKMTDKVKFFEGVSKLQVLAGDKDAYKQMSKKVENQKVIDVLMADQNFSNTVKTSPVLQTMLKLSHEGYGDPTAAVGIFKDLVAQGVVQRDAQYANDILVNNYALASSGKESDWKQVEANLKGMMKNPEKAATVTAVFGSLTKAHEAARAEAGATRRAALAARGGSTEKVGEYDKDAIASVGKLRTAAQAYRTGKQIVTDEMGMQKTVSVPVDEAAAARLDTQAAQQAAQYISTGKITPSTAKAIADSFPEEQRSALVSTLRGGGNTPRQAINPKISTTPVSAAFGQSLGGNFGAILGR